MIQSCSLVLNAAYSCSVKLVIRWPPFALFSSHHDLAIGNLNTFTNFFLAPILVPEIIINNCYSWRGEVCKDKQEGKFEATTGIPEWSRVPC